MPFMYIIYHVYTYTHTHRPSTYELKKQLKIHNLIRFRKITCTSPVISLYVFLNCQDGTVYSRRRTTNLLMENFSYGRGQDFLFRFREEKLRLNVSNDVLIILFWGFAVPLSNDFSCLHIHGSKPSYCTCVFSPVHV